MKLFVLDDYQNVVSRLDAALQLAGIGVQLHTQVVHVDDEAQLIADLQEADILVLIRERTTITAAIIDALPRLKLIVQTGRQSGCIDLEACTRRGIQVREGGGSPVAPAELTWALVMAASRRLVGYAEQLRQGRWQRSAERMAQEELGAVLHGRRLGIWGLGRIGSLVAGYGKAFGMEVLVHGREQSRAAAKAAGYTYVADRHQFLASADVVSLHLKLTPQTRHMISAQDLTAMGADSLLVNTSRAELMAPGALLIAMSGDGPGFAALDVFESEPHGVAAYLHHPRILCTPHIGFVERSTYDLYFDTAFRQVREFVLGGGA
ncbi:MAG TPA: D-2-hydroxyacid dehydrogenase family protein [Rhodocyclaceae bacterium]|nr:D-2-hydroxyacid dehydrogenase family protein [Rhodocyclaceae bacterium]